MESNLLSQLNIAQTPFRMSVLRVLSEGTSALSQKEIESEISGNIDRVTLYRTLKLFVSKQLVHKITLDDKSVKYQLINPSKGTAHPHFHCQSCDKVICLSELPIPKLTLPSGFTQASLNFVVEGTCNCCH